MSSLADYGSHCWLVLAFMMALSLLTSSLYAEDIFDANGFNTNRGSFSNMSFEHVDPMTGNLILSHTDFTVPGDGGFALKVQRTYNSKIHINYETASAHLVPDSWAGLGWTLHFGRVLNSDVTSGTYTATRPSIEMPDGSQHTAYWQSGSTFMTKDYWRYNAGTTPTLEMPDGTVYTFGHHFLSPQDSCWVSYVTRIEDPFGNNVE
jgi:hypothetical protein